MHFIFRYNGGEYIHRHTIPRYETTVKCYIDLFGERPSNTSIWPLYEGEPYNYAASRSVAAVSYDEEEYSSAPVFRHQVNNHEAVIVHEESPSVLQLAHPVNASSSLEYVEVATSEVADQGGICTIRDMDVSMEVEMDVKNGKATTLINANAQDTSDNAGDMTNIEGHLSNRPKKDIAVKLNVTAPPFVPNVTASPFVPKTVAATAAVNESNITVNTSSDQGLGGSEQDELANARAVVETSASVQNVPAPSFDESRMMASPTVVKDRLILPPWEDIVEGNVAVAGDGMKICSICTCINPKLHLSCSACGSIFNCQDEPPDEEFMTTVEVVEKMEDMRLHGSSSASLEQVKIAKSSQSPLSAKARPFTPPGFSSSSRAKSVSADAKSAKSKAVVVSLSGPKQSATKTRPTVLPGMEYLMGEDEARVVAERKAQLEKKKAKKQGQLVEKAQRKAEERKAAESDRKRRMEAKREKEAAMKQHEKEVQKYQQVEMPADKTTISSPPKPKLAQDDEELPSVDEMMSFLGDKSMSKEERQKQLDKMFG